MIATPICQLPPSFNTPAKAVHFFQAKLSCGFPSPADDYAEDLPTLNELLIKHSSDTFLARAKGDSMIERGILDGSLLIIDKSIKPANGSTIVASIAGEFTVKILDLDNRLLLPANPKHKPIPIPDELDTVCEDVVTFCITPQEHSSFTC